MKRDQVRDLKRAIRAGTRQSASVRERDLSRTSALALLERSIQFGHDRLAVLRLEAAIRAGAKVTPRQWQYCASVASHLDDDGLRDRILSALHDLGRKLNNDWSEPLAVDSESSRN